MNRRVEFEDRVLPHLDAAYNLARWLLGSGQNAEDAVQEAALRAFRYFDSLKEDDARPWFLGIARNVCFTMLERKRQLPISEPLDEGTLDTVADSTSAGPEGLAQLARTQQRVDSALRALAPAHREVIILREFEEFEYTQIAAIVGVPVGTVMSRLSRARERLRELLGSQRGEI